MARRGYPPEFRRRIVELVEGGRKVAEVAVEFEVSEQTIYTWRRQSRIDVGLEGGGYDVRAERTRGSEASHS
jgi:transposase-like protein